MPLIDVADPRKRWAVATFGMAGFMFAFLVIWHVAVDGDLSLGTAVELAATALVAGALWGAYLYWRLRDEIRASRAGRD